MKKKVLILAMVMVASLSMKAQYGGVINAINNSGVLGQIRRNVSALMTSDSIAAVKLDSVKAHLPITNGKLSIDSISIKSMPTFSVSATNPSVSATGSAIPSSATMVGGSDGTNLKALQTNSAGNLRLDSAYLRKVVSVDNFPATYPVTGTFWQATQPVSLSSVPTHAVTQSGTWNVGLSAGANAIGSITNTSFGISGTLPAFASTPTVNSAQSGTWNITNLSGTVSLPTGASTAAKQPALGTSGTASSDVITVQGITGMTALKVDGSAVTQPVSISGTVTTTGGLTDAQLRASAVPVSLASVPSHAVTNAGTFATQVTSLPALPTGSNAIGSITNTSFGISGTLPAFAATPTVNIGTTGTIPVSGTITTTPPSNASTNISQINGVTPLMGNGVTGTGSPRVTIASDNTPFTVNSAQSGSWNINNITSVTTLPLPTGASTDATLNDVKSNQTNGSQLSNVYDVSTGANATVINNSGTNPLSVQQTNSTGVPIDLASSVNDNGALNDGYIFYGYDRNNTKTHPISAKEDGDLLDGEYGIPFVAWNNDNTQYNFLRVNSSNMLMVTNPDDYTISQNQINGTQKSIIRGGAKGSTTAADVTSTATGANHQAVDVAIMDGSGNQITSFGGGTQYAELNTTNPATGTVALGRYLSTPPTLTNAQLSAPMLDASGNLKVNIVSGGGGGTQYSEATTTSPATGTSSLFRYNETTPTLTDGGMYMPQLDVNGNQKVSNVSKTATGTITTQNLNPTGTATAGSAVELDVDGYGGALLQVTGSYSGSLSLQYTVNGTTWVTNGLTGMLVLATYAHTYAVASGATGLYRITTFGAKKIRITALSSVTPTATISLIAQLAAPTVSIEGNTGGTALTVTANIQSGASTIHKSEDNAAANGDGGVTAWGVRMDTLTAGTTLTSANGDYIAEARTNHGAVIVKDEITHKKTYRVTTGGFNPAASATDIFTITGVANVKISVTKIIVSATQTSGSIVDVTCLTRRSANNAGTFTTVAGAKMDIGGSTSFANCVYYTANPTTGTLGGTLETIPYFSPSTASQPLIYTFDFGSKGQPVILTTASHCVSINLGGVTVTGGRFYITAEYTEEFGIGIIFIIIGILYLLGILKMNIP